MSEGALVLVLAAGDFNFDPLLADGDDRAGLESMVAAAGLERLSFVGETHTIFPMEIDMIFRRGWKESDEFDRSQRFLDGGAEAPMIDHAWVGCR